FGHAEFKTFNDSVTALFAKWKKANTARLKGIAVGDRPKALVETISEHLLEEFAKDALVDPYDVYQHLMTYWADAMQDDVYAISHDGWVKAAQVRQLVPGKDKSGKTVWGEAHDLVLGKKRYKADLIPPSLIVARYFERERAE